MVEVFPVDDGGAQVAPDDILIITAQYVDMGGPVFVGERDRSMPAQLCARRFTQLWQKLRNSIIIEGHQSTVEGRIL